MKASSIAALGAGITLLLAAGPALAVPGYSTAHLNLRTGPGTQYPVVGVMEYNVRSEHHRVPRRLLLVQRSPSPASAAGPRPSTW